MVVAVILGSKNFEFGPVDKDIQLLIGVFSHVTKYHTMAFYLAGRLAIKISLFRSLFRFWLSQMIAVVDTNGVLQQQFVGKDEL